MRALLLIATAIAILALGPAPLPARPPPAVDHLVTAVGHNRFTIAVAAGAEGAVGEAVTAAGGAVEVTAGGVLQATLPRDSLANVARTPGVRWIAPALPLLPADLASEGYKAIGFPTVPPSPAAGAGVKVGIIDSFAGYEGLLGSELPPPERVVFRRFSPSPAPSSHGVAVAEIVHDVAPMATLYLAEAHTVAEVAAAVDWLLAEGVQVINMSLVAPFSPPAGAPGSIAALTAEKAARAGALWVASAGNFGDKHWAGPFRDDDGDGLLEFAPGVETASLSLGSDAARPFLAVLRWDDAWGGTCDDYVLLASWDDVALGPRQVEADASQDCSPAAWPLEIAGGNAHPRDGLLRLRVQKKPGARPRRLDLFVLGGSLSPSVPEGSIAPPADSPFALAVGAVAAYDPSRLQPYSSRGLGPGGAIKPDLVAPDTVSTATYGPWGFAGTSASAPHVTGLAAAVKSALPQLDLQGLKGILLSSAQDLGAPGPDPSFGYGLARLPPSLPPATASWLPSPPSLAGIWPIEGERERAMITWAPPPGATRYRVQSALDPAFTFGVNTLEFPSGPYNLLVVGAPTWDGGVFYYRIAACNDEGCSGWSQPLALGRRIWPGPEHWNLLAGGFRFLDRLYLWGVNASPIPGKASEIRLYEGLQGFGGILRKACPGVAPGASCQADFASISALASVSQAFPPYGQVGIGFWTP